MKTSNFFVLILLSLCCVARAAEPLEQADESNKPGIARILSEKSFAAQAELLDLSQTDSPRTTHAANAMVAAGFGELKVERRGERVLWVRSIARNAREKADRAIAVECAISVMLASAVTHLLVECGSDKSANGSWGPLALELCCDGQWQRVSLAGEYVDRGGVICSYVLPCALASGKVLNALRLVAEAPNDESRLYIRRMALGTSSVDSTRALAIETLTEKTRIRTYPAGTDVAFRVRGKEGVPLADDTLQWIVVDWNGKVRQRGKVPFGRVEWEKGVVVTVPGKDLGAGYFQFCPRLASDGATVPREGSRPKGFESFGLLPALEIPKLAHADESRFGAQGTVRAYEEQGLSPAYDMLGIRWVYSNARPVNARPTRETVYEPMSVEAVKTAAAWDVYAQRGYAPLVNMHGIPGWMAKLPDGISPEALAKDPTRLGQKYPLDDEAAYADLVGRLMTTEARRREFARPSLVRNWYELHWEPDWHWSGTDEEFIAYYRLAREAMDKADPTAVLTAANYGVIDKGNALLKRLFEKGLGRYVNGLTTHLYLLRPDWPEGAGLADELHELRQMADTYLGKDAPIINTEGGTEHKGNPARVDDLRAHAARLVRGHLIALGEGCTTTFLFYASDFAKYSRAMIHYGLFFNEDTQGRLFGPDSIAPKPAGMAVAAMIRLLEGTKTIGRVPDLGDGVYAYAFQRGKTRIIAVWSPEGPREVTLKTASKSVTCYDFMGNPRSIPVDKGTLRLSARQEPCYLMY